MVYIKTKEHQEKITLSLRKGNYFSCLTCGTTFWRSPSVIKKGDNKYCSKNCYLKSEQNKSEKPHISKIMSEKVGEKSPSWKGGITPLHKIIRQSKEYLEWRISVFERDNYTCIKCGFRSQKGKYIPIQAHHIKSFAEYAELRFDINNGETLCKDCHKKTDNHAKHKKYHK